MLLLPALFAVRFWEVTGSLSPRRVHAYSHRNFHISETFFLWSQSIFLSCHSHRESRVLRIKLRHATHPLPFLPSPKQLPENAFFSTAIESQNLSLTIPVPTGNFQRLDGHHVRGCGLTRGEGTRRGTLMIPGVDSLWQTGSRIPELRLAWILGYSITSGSAFWC